MWKFWYELTSEQKSQSRDLDQEVRMFPSEFWYYVEVDTDEVISHEKISQ